MKKFFDMIGDLFSDQETPDIPHYDPVHIGAMIVIIVFAMAILFWLLWSLLVFGGGIQAKVVPVIQILFGSKTSADFGYVGYPYEMGVFEGWVTNVIALGFLMLVIVVIWHVFERPEHTKSE